MLKLLIHEKDELKSISYFKEFKSNAFILYHKKHNKSYIGILLTL